MALTTPAIYASGHDPLPSRAIATSSTASSAGIPAPIVLAIAPPGVDSAFPFSPIALCAHVVTERRPAAAGR
ncbi:MAG TPA: hypothetical protein VHI13_01425 [Candidatus Kapabacteria bacterium]|nr:hypothetical protein [Candidatus Kapabacteria bacterium]